MTVKPVLKPIALAQKFIFSFEDRADFGIQEMVICWLRHNIFLILKSGLNEEVHELKGRLDE